MEVWKEARASRGQSEVLVNIPGVCGEDTERWREPLRQTGVCCKKA